MPTSVIGAAISAVFAGSTLAPFAIGWSWAAFSSALVLGAISKAIAKKPDQGSTAANFAQQGRMVTVRQPIAPWRIVYGTDRVGGVLTYKEVTSNNATYHMVLTLAGHESEEIGDIYFADEVIPLDGSIANGGGAATGRFAGAGAGLGVYVEKSLGNETYQPFNQLVSSSAGLWTDAHRQTGHTKIHVQLVADLDLYPNGVPNITAVVKGRKVYDPRSGLTVWSYNPALCVADYLCDPVIGFGADYATEIDEAALIAAANICDEAVELAGGGSPTPTEARYHLNGSFELSEKPRDILGKMLATMAGKAVLVGGVWKIIAGAYTAPSITLDEDDLAGPIELQALVARTEACNGVKGVFVDPAALWQPTDFPPVASATYMAEDNDERIWKDLDFSGFVRGAPLAQRLAKIELLRARQGLTVTMPCKLTAYRLQPGDTVAVDNTKFGWSAKAFEVVKGTFTIAEDGTLSYTLVLRETAAAIFDWSSSEEQSIDIAPNTSLGDPFSTPDAPGAPVLTEELYQTTGSSGVKARALISWSASMNGFVDHYAPEYKLSASSAWTPLAVTVGLTASISDIAPGTYNFRVRSFTARGQASAYSATATREFLGLTALPSDATNFSVTKVSGVAVAAWDLSTDLDVQVNGAAVVRHSPLTSGAVWNDGVVLEEFPGGAVQGSLPLITGTYMLKFRDSSGNYSSGAATFVATEGMVTGFTTVATVTEHSGFAGSKTNVVVSGLVLQLDTIGSPQVLSTSGTYLFAGSMDHGSVATRRYEVDLAVSSFDTGDLIDSRTALMDSWDDFDGSGDIHDCDVTVYGRFSADPSGSPAPEMGPWVPFFVSDFTARYAEFKAVLESASSNHNISISTLAVDAKEPA